MKIKSFENFEAFENYTEKHEIKTGEFVGLWVDNGLIYIDVSERVERLSAAISLGIERKQKSIFDWCLSRCIGLEG